VDGDRRVVRIHEAMYAYTNNFVDKVTAACNSNMDYSLGRILARVTGVETTEDETTATEAPEETGETSAATESE